MYSGGSRIGQLGGGLINQLLQKSSPLPSLPVPSPPFQSFLSPFHLLPTSPALDAPLPAASDAASPQERGSGGSPEKF
jgi:hypothetical protein